MVSNNASTRDTAGQPTKALARRRVAAFFDLDKTIIATSSAFAFGKEFMNSGMITKQEAFELYLAKTSYMFTGMSGEQMDTTRDQLASMIAGWSVDDVRKVTAETMHNVVTPAIYAEARELIAFHKAAGHDIIIVSASASHLVEPIAAELGVTKVVATEAEVVDGKFTGRITKYVKGPAKAEAITELAESHAFDLANSFAYSDSATDIPMMEKVGHPVAVNPDRAMKKHALEQGWEIRAFKHPEPLFHAPSAREVGIGAGVIAGITALAAGGVWVATKLLRDPRTA
ncbi:HAD family hydrolase [Corynebacterium breve]|uniref:HAD family hydrolase n=1 Tax=Corynebacterium breve TaxID=3049799 RepID=A0ABY8VG48_9CORY|nr:HAD family hydrolase [Corynebacterium breve]WIM67941.1 HAD family hydrolase [Corynebacterium breve]